MQDLTGFAHVIPTHQGRAAERILFHTHAAARRQSSRTTSTSTPRAPTSRSRRPRRATWSSPKGAQPSALHPFKGNIDLAALERLLERATADRVPLVMVTVTNNSGGGQPVSMENLRGVRALCDRYRQAVLPRRLPLRRERLLHQAARAGLRATGRPKQIAREMFALADGCTMSAQEGRPGQHRRLPGA